MIKEIITKISQYLKESSSISLFKFNEYHIYSFGWIALFAHPIFWYIWSFITPQKEDLTLRIACSFSCLILLILLYNRKKFDKILPLYWIFCIFFNLPFFFSLLLIVNNFNNNWLMSQVVMIFVITIFIPNIIFSFLMIGFGLFTSNYYAKLFYGENFSYDVDLFLYHFPVYGLAFFSAHVFCYATLEGEKNFIKSRIFKSLSGSIAHELRNPLNVINLVGNQIRDSLNEFEKIKNLQKKCCEAVYQSDPNTQNNCPNSRPNNPPPLNLETGEIQTSLQSKNSLSCAKNNGNIAVSNQQKIAEIILNIKTQLTENTEHITSAINNANNIINIILADLSEKQIDENDFKLISAHQIILQTIDDYGYKNDIEKSKIFTNFSASSLQKLPEGHNPIQNELSNIQTRDFIIKTIPDRLTYILFNLIKNALYYLAQFPDATITIGTEANKNIDGKNYNVIFVHDTGPGIPTEIIPRLFDDFFTSGKKDGTGLGLAFCKRNMKLFGGNIICESETKNNNHNSRFTKFSLLFPIQENQNLEDQEEIIKNLQTNFSKINQINNSQKLNETEVNKILQNKKILLADDQDLNRKITKRLFEKYGAIVSEVHDGKELLEAYTVSLKSSIYFDLIITDINMPPFNGDEAVVKIRKTENNITQDNTGKTFANLKSIPIIALTGDGDRKNFNKFAKLGFNNCFVKGQDNDDLLRMTIDLLKIESRL